MTPIKFLETLLSVNRTGAIFIMTGLGVLAAAALGVSFLGDGTNALTLAVYVIVFAVAVSILSYIVSNPLMKAVLGWMMICGVGLIMGISLDSVLQLSGKTPYPDCLRRILELPPHACQAEFDRGDVVLASNPAANDEQDEPSEYNSSPTWEAITSMQAPDTDIEPEFGDVPPSGAIMAAPVITTATSDQNAEPQIFLQFTSGISRDEAKSTAKQLDDLGWTIDDGTNGGEEVDQGPSVTSIRYYSAEYADTARFLAEDLSSTLGNIEIRLQNFSRSGLIAPRNLLEIWLAPTG